MLFLSPGFEKIKFPIQINSTQILLLIRVPKPQKALAWIKSEIFEFIDEKNNNQGFLNDIWRL